MNQLIKTNKIQIKKLINYSFFLQKTIKEISISYLITKILNYISLNQIHFKYFKTNKQMKIKLNFLYTKVIRQDMENLEKLKKWLKMINNNI